MSDNTPQKRIRASGEVLNFLINEFNKNQNPSPDRRKFISDKASMSEKAVRIWFQNRRAKQRKHERQSSTVIGDLNDNHIQNFYSANSSNTSSNDSLSSPSKLNSIEVNDNYCCIDSSSLSVGSWQRIKSGIHDENLLKNNLINLSPFTLNNIMQNVDLLVILSKKNHELNYFFSAISNGSKILFRIFYPINSIINCSIHNKSQNEDNNELKIYLNRQPKFSVYFFNGVNSTTNQWSICDDFSEGQQVSQAYNDPVNQFHNQNNPNANIPHVIVGTKYSLGYLCRFINENNLYNQNQNLNHQNQNQINFMTANPSDVIAPLKHNSFDYGMNSTNFNDSNNNNNLYTQPSSTTSSNFISSLPMDQLNNLNTSNFIQNNQSSTTTTTISNTNSTNINESPFSVSSNQFYHSDTPQSTQSFNNLNLNGGGNENKLIGDLNLNNLKTTTPEEILFHNDQQQQQKDLNSYTHLNQSNQGILGHNDLNLSNLNNEFDFTEFSSVGNHGDSSTTIITNLQPPINNSSPANHPIDFMDFGN